MSRRRERCRHAAGRPPAGAAGAAGALGITFALLAVFVSPTAAGSLEIPVERELDEAWLAAEVSVLSVRVAEFQRDRPDPGAVRVRVTEDPRRIYRGFAYLGHVLRLSPAHTGPQLCTADLQPLAGSKTRVLLVVRPDRSIVLRGLARGRPRGEIYRLRGWSDYQVCVPVTKARTLGRQVDDASGYRGLDVPRGALVLRARDERRAFYARVARYLADRQRRVDRARIHGWIADLASPDGERRIRAQALLRRHGVMHVAELRQAATTSNDPEVRRRLGELLRSMERYSDAYDVSLRLLGAPVADRLYVAREGLFALAASERVQVAAFVERLAAAR